MPRKANRSQSNTPEKLASKLLEIRIRLKESQGGLLVRLGIEKDFERSYVSKWERGLLEPQLFVLCAYADVANIFLDVLARDVLELPLVIPAKVKSMGLQIDFDKNLSKSKKN